MKKMKNLTFIIIGLLLFMFHFTMLIMAVGPNNPVSVKYREEIAEYTHPLFFQNWNLFAPEPIENTQQVLIKYENEKGKKSDWQNISQPIFDSNQSNPISAMNRTARIPSGIFLGIYKPDNLITTYQQKAQERDQDQDIEEIANNDAILEQKEQQVDLLYRFAYSSIPLITNHQEVSSVKVRFLNEEPVPYSERNNENFQNEKTYIDFGWREFEYVKPYDT
jgi:hypothetical protein